MCGGPKTLCIFHRVLTHKANQPAIFVLFRSSCTYTVRIGKMELFVWVVVVVVGSQITLDLVIETGAVELTNSQGTEVIR